VISKAVLAALCSSTWSAWPLLPSITIGAEPDGLRAQPVYTWQQLEHRVWRCRRDCGREAAVVASAPGAPSPVGIGRLRVWEAPGAPPEGWQVAMT